MSLKYSDCTYHIPWKNILLIQMQTIEIIDQRYMFIRE